MQLLKFFTNIWPFFGISITRGYIFHKKIPYLCTFEQCGQTECAHSEVPQAERINK